MAALVKPPEPCPAEYEEDVSKIHEGLAKLFTSCGIPYFIQCTLARSGFCTTGDVKWRWGTPAEAIAKGPTELGFIKDKNGYDAVHFLPKCKGGKQTLHVELQPG